MHAPYNRARGEVLLNISGRDRRLCVTLGALAELEAAFDAANLEELAGRLAHLGPSDLLTVLAALTAGGGEPMNTAELASAAIEPLAAVRAVARAFHAAFADET